MTELTHDRCSELLRSFEEGQLAASEAAAVEAHLASCEECATERAGLTLLLAHEAGSLTDSERTRLRAGIAAAMARDRTAGGRIAAGAVPVPGTSRRRRRWRERMGPGLRLLAAAAVVVAGFVFATTVLPNGGGDSGTGGGAEPEVAGQGTLDVGAARAAPTPVFADAAAAEAVATEENEAAADEGGRGQAARAQVAAPFTRIGLKKVGRSEEPFTDFAAVYTVDDADRLAEPFLEQLADSAPNEELASAVLICGGQVLDDPSSRPVLPAFAAYSTVGGEQSLIMGFVSSDEGSGALDRYQMRVWGGTDCDRQTYFNEGPIRTRR